MLLIRVGVGRGEGVVAKANKEPTTSEASTAQKKENTPAQAKAKESTTEASSGGGGDDDLDPSKLDIRVGLVRKCTNHPESEKLLCEEIDLGEGEPRQIASGLRPHYTAEDLTGRMVLVMCNLKPRAIAGFQSNGMVLCACNSDHTVVKLLQPPQDAKIGEQVTFKGHGTGAPASASVMAKKKILEKLGPHLQTDEEGKCRFGKDGYFTLESGIVKADTLLANANIS